MNSQNHKSSTEELDYHPTMYFPTSSHDGILALIKKTKEKFKSDLSLYLGGSKYTVEELRTKCAEIMYHCMTVANPRYKLLEEETCLQYNIIGIKGIHSSTTQIDKCNGQEPHPH